MLFWALVFLTVYVGSGYVAAFMWGGSDCLPTHLVGQKHYDRIWLKSWMSRSWTCRRLVEPPIMVLGSNGHRSVAALNGRLGPVAVPDSGHWQFSLAQVRKGSIFFLPYFAFTVRGWHCRIGTRWDSVDHYFILDSLSFKKLRHSR